MAQELKARLLGQTMNEYGCDTKIYLKSEADKVIDFWKNESHNHYERWFNLNKQFESWFSKVCRCERAERELRHQKYKRCFKMARWCLYWANYWETCEPSDCSMFIIKARYYRKWQKRWLALAEKFKEAK